MQKVKIEWLKRGKESISQIYSNGLEFAFATKKEQCTDFIYCKDFLQDCVHASFLKKKISPYGFKYDPKTKPIDLKKTFILVANSSDPDMEAKIVGCQDFLNQVEKKLGLFRTKIAKCTNAPDNYQSGVYLYRGSGMWLNSPPMLSLYSLFIRIGFCHKVGTDFVETLDAVQNGKIPPYQRNDKNQLTQSRDGINAILKLGYRKFFYKDTEKNYPAVDIMTMHNYFGIVGFTQMLKNGDSNEMPKYWSRKSVKKLIAETAKEK